MLLLLAHDRRGLEPIAGGVALRQCATLTILAAP
jgi:hypothetical protein